MRSSIQICLIVLLLPSFVFGEEANQPTPNSKIPFIVEGSRSNYSSQDSSFSSATPLSMPKASNLLDTPQTPNAVNMSHASMSAATDTLREIDTTAVKEIVKKFRDDICEVNTGGEFEVSLKVDVSGNILAVSASSEAGLKVRIICDVKDKKK